MQADTITVEETVYVVAFKNTFSYIKAASRN